MTGRAAAVDRRSLRIAAWHHLPSGGGKRALVDQVRGLVGRGHTIEAWCPPTADRDFLPIADLIPEHVLPLEPVRLPAMTRAIYRRAHADAWIPERLEQIRRHRIACDAAISPDRFDVIYASPCRWFFAPPAPSSRRLPSVLFLQEPCRRLYEAFPELPWLAEPDEPAISAISLQKLIGSALRIHPQRLQARRELENVRGFDLVLVNSMFSRESVIRTFGIDARVCYLGIDTSRFAVSDRPRQRTVLSVGYFDEHKRPEFIIRAVAASRTRPAVRWIANQATPEYAERMRQLARELGVAFQLDIGVTDAELVSAYQEATVLAYAPRLEPFGFAPLEANACGTPAVVIAEGGTRETVVDGENGRIATDARDMAAAIDDFIASPERTRAIGDRAAELVRQRWTLDAATARLERYLYEAVEGHAPRNTD